MLTVERKTMGAVQHTALGYEDVDICWYELRLDGELIHTVMDDEVSARLLSWLDEKAKETTK